MPFELMQGVLLLAGAACGVIGAAGVLRFPDLFTRMHAAGVTETLCALLILTGLALTAGFTLAAFKLFLILLFLWFTSPTATHALAKAALKGGVRPLRTSGEDLPSKS